LLGRILLIFETEIRAQEGFFIIDRHNAAQSVKVSTEPKKSIKPTNLLKNHKTIGGGFF
jgi:hypothetical protein